MRHRLHGLKGADFRAKQQEIFEEEEAAIAQRFMEIRQDTGKFTPHNLGELCNEFRLPVTVMDRFLTELVDNSYYPHGTWDRLKRSRDKYGYKITASRIGVIWE